MKHVFGLPISQVSMDDLCDRLAVLAELRESPSTVCLVNSQSLVEAHRDPGHMASLLDADLCLPDGWPIAALARTRRIAGADLMLAAARHPTIKRMRHTLYGGFGVAFDAAVRQWKEAGSPPTILAPWVPTVDATGYADPQKEMNARWSLMIEFLVYSDEKNIAAINATQPDFLWVALGCPKQEAWMVKYKSQFNAKVIIGVGAAFNFLAGRVQRAPVWMQRVGLEGVYRIKTERSRWRRPVGAGIGLIQLLLGFRPR